jgi:hypothetical protein
VFCGARKRDPRSARDRTETVEVMEQTGLLHRITSSRRLLAAQLSIDRAQTPDIDRVIGSGMTLYLVCIAVKINFGTTGSGGGQNSSVKGQSSTISNSQISLSFLKPRFMVPMLRIHRTVTAFRRHPGKRRELT